MPHLKDGTRVKRFDRVRAPVGYSYTPDRPQNEPVLADALVIAVDEDAQYCELTLLIGSAAFLGTMSLPQLKGDPHPPRAGVLLDGYWTTCNAKDCVVLDKP